MHTKKHHIVRKTIIVLSSLILGIVGTVIVAATYDANIQTRVGSMMKSIKTNASALAPSDASAYYTLVHLNIQSLLKVLVSVDEGLLAEISNIPELQDANVLTQIAGNTGVTSNNTGITANNTGVSLSNTESTSTTGKITINVAGGTNMLCGDPARNDYMSWSDANWQSARTNVIDKAYCNTKGNDGVGYVWNVCNGVITNKKTVNSLVEGETFSCSNSASTTNNSSTTTTTNPAGTTTQNYLWSCVVAGPVSVNTSQYSCNSSNINKTQKINGYDCTCISRITTTNTTNPSSTSPTNTSTIPVACTGNGNNFNFSNSTQTNQCVGVMPTGYRGDTKTVNATQGAGTATVTCGATGWSITAANCTTDKNATTASTTSTAAGSSLKCTKNGIEYISGDVRCDNKNQVRCDNGTFKQIYTCGANETCTENKTRTSNNNFFTSCKRTTDIFSTISGTSDSIFGHVPESEISNLKKNANYRCSLNTSTELYENCVYQSCYVGTHDEGGECVFDIRECSISNAANGGRQTWSAGTWGTCQSTSSTTCATGYRMMDGVCKTGAETCNEPVIGVSGKAINIIGAYGVDYSTATYNGYLGGGVWQYNTANISEACTYRCKEGFKRTSEISGYRGDQICEVKVPVVTLTASKTKVNPGDTVTLTWNATDMVNTDPVTSNSSKNFGCYFLTDGTASTGPLTTWASGVGFNMRPSSGSEQVTITKNMTFQVDCRASIRNNGARSEIISIAVTPPPTLGLKIANGGGTGGDFIELQWNMTNAISCTVGGPGASILGWTSAGPATDFYQSKRFSFTQPSIINYLPGKKITLTCTGLGGTSTVETEYSKNNQYGSCVAGVYYKAGNIYPDPNAAFTTWLRDEYVKYGRLSIDTATITKWTDIWKTKIVSGVYDSAVKSEITTAIQSELSGNWNICSE